MTSTSTISIRHGRTLGAARLAWAVTLVAAPTFVIGALGGQVNSKSVTVARVLGARHVVQGVAEITAWPRWRRSGALADVAHSLTVAGLGVTDPRWRRVAVADSVIAAAFALTGLAG